MDVKTLPLYIAVFVSGMLAFENASVIFTGGVGKNGSTVAVSWIYLCTNILHYSHKYRIFNEEIMIFLEYWTKCTLLYTSIA